MSAFLLTHNFCVHGGNIDRSKPFWFWMRPRMEFQGSIFPTSHVFLGLWELKMVEVHIVGIWLILFQTFFCQNEFILGRQTNFQCVCWNLHLSLYKDLKFSNFLWTHEKGVKMIPRCFKNSFWISACTFCYLCFSLGSSIFLTT